MLVGTHDLPWLNVAGASWFGIAARLDE
jgi:hypothetical protein